MLIIWATARGRGGSKHEIYKMMLRPRQWQDTTQQQHRFEKWYFNAVYMYSRATHSVVLLWRGNPVVGPFLCCANWNKLLSPHSAVTRQASPGFCIRASTVKVWCPCYVWRKGHPVRLKIPFQAWQQLFYGTVSLIFFLRPPVLAVERIYYRILGPILGSRC